MTGGTPELLHSLPAGHTSAASPGKSGGRKRGREGRSLSEGGTQGRQGGRDVTGRSVRERGRDVTCRSVRERGRGGWRLGV